MNYLDKLYNLNDRLDEAEQTEREKIRKMARELDSALQEVLEKRKE